MNKKGLLIFDFDGVIVDSVPLMYEYTKKAIPFLSWSLYQRLFDNPLFLKSIKWYSRTFRKKTPQSLKDKRSQYTIDKLEKTMLVDGISNMIIELSNDYELTLNTNANIPNTIPLLEKHNLRKYFSLIKTRDDSVFKTEKTKQILEELKWDPEEALFITDSFRDVLDAKKVDVKSVGVLTGAHLEHHFRQKSVLGNVIAITKNSGELKEAIENYFKNEG